MAIETHGPALKSVPEPTQPLRRIVCGVDGSRAAYAGVRQAAELAGAGASLELVAVTDERGVGASAQATLDPAHAEQALERAAEIATQFGARPKTVSAYGETAATVLLEEAADADLLVVASHGHTRIGGILIGSTASRLVHLAPLPVLVARPLAEGRSLVDNVLVAAGGGYGSAAVSFTERIVSGRAAKVTLLRMDGRADPIRRPELSAARARLQAVLGVEPVEFVRSGSVLPGIADFAGADKSSLLVVGSRGLRGRRAHRSVSERVAHEAPCSVVVVRPAIA